MVIMVSTWHLFHSIRSKALVNRKFERHRTMKCGYLPLDRADCYGANSGPSERFWNYLRQVNQCHKGQNFALHTRNIFFFQTNFFIVRKPCFQESALPASCLWNRWTLQCTESFEWFAPLYHVGRSGGEWRHSTAMPSCQYFLVVSMIWFSYSDKLYIIMLGITFSPQNYHHHQQFISKLRENNENVMTSVVWAVIVFSPHVWQLSVCR